MFLRKTYYCGEKPSDIRGILHLFFGTLFPVYVMYFQLYDHSVYHNIHLFCIFVLYTWSGIFHIFDFNRDHIFQRLDYINIYLYMSSNIILHMKQQFFFALYTLIVAAILLIIPFKLLIKIKVWIYVLTAVFLMNQIDVDYSQYYDILTCFALSGIFYVCDSQYLWYKNIISNHDISHLCCVMATTLYCYKTYHK